MNDKVYDVLNKIQRWLPALSSFYVGLCLVWGFSYGDEISKTIALVGTLLAATLEVFGARWSKDHQINIVDMKEDVDGYDDFDD